MASPSSRMILLPVIFVALAGIILASILREPTDAVGTTAVGSPAPAVPDEPVDGTALITDADLRSGEVTIVNFWASWCPPCRAEHPRLIRFANEGLRIIGVNFDDAAPEATAYLAAEGNPFAAVAFDPDSEVARAWGVDGPPQTFILAPDGTVVFHFVGPLVGSDFEQRFLPALRATQNALGAGARR